MEDQRAANRSLKRVTVRFGPEGPKFAGFSKNLSPTGLFLKTPKVFKTGTRLYLQVRAGEEIFEMMGTVVWVKVAPPRLAMALESGMGIHFDEPSQEWQEFCASLRR